jgi:regulation of enolase protein 1 (concanavalin A-like superfamily)
MVSESTARKTTAGATYSTDSWLNEPQSWHLEGDSLVCSADPKTDFWRKTESGTITDNGHFFRRRMRGDFTCSVRISGDYHEIFDQAGLMVRVDSTRWVKCGIELFEGRPNVSAVFTRDSSDWSTFKLPEPAGSVWIKLTRKGPTLDVFYALNDKQFSLCRSGFIGNWNELEVGRMCAAPVGNGFRAQFDEFSIAK